jgi:hypothetical protein
MTFELLLGALYNNNNAGTYIIPMDIRREGDSQR